MAYYIVKCREGKSSKLICAKRVDRNLVKVEDETTYEYGSRAGHLK
ncbi:hypothetical protein ACYUJ6_16140 [Clostridium sp. JNZ X4-2]